MFTVILLDFYKPFAHPKNVADLNFRSVILSGRNLTHGTTLEIVWTVTPSIILLFDCGSFFCLIVFYG